METFVSTRQVAVGRAFGANMNDDRLTEALAERVLGWKVAPGRFIKSGRTWMPRWRFAPLKNLEHAFALLDQAADTCTLAITKSGTFSAEVRVGGRIGKASGEPKARTITVALARALGIAVPDETLALVSVRSRPRKTQSRRGVDGA
jgi:hypothetical protein